MKVFHENDLAMDISKDSIRVYSDGIEVARFYFNNLYVDRNNVCLLDLNPSNVRKVHVTN
jgi:hypothetical protein